jgi:aminoglycoside 6'-N-acetyltransferase
VSLGQLGLESGAMELRGDRVLLRPLRVEDAHRIAELAADPEVAQWWPDLTEAEVVGKAEGRGDSTGFAVLRDSELIGLVQYYEELDPEYRHAGIDLFIGAPYQDRGLGTDTVCTMARHLVHDRGHHRLIIDPAADNERAIRCYEKVGFRSVGILREYQRAPDGTWQDGVLLDLLARELD